MNTGLQGLFPEYSSQDKWDYHFKITLQQTCVNQERALTFGRDIRGTFIRNVCVWGNFPRR